MICREREKVYNSNLKNELMDSCGITHTHTLREREREREREKCANTISLGKTLILRDKD
jgi:hypothetical protein